MNGDYRQAGQWRAWKGKKNLDGMESDATVSPVHFNVHPLPPLPGAQLQEIRPVLKALQKLCNASFAILFMALGLLAVTMGCGGGNQSGTATQSVVVNMATDPELDDKLFVMTINNKSSLSLSTISYQTVSSISTTVTDPITHEPTTTTVTGAPVPHTVTLIPPVRPGSSVAGTFIYDSDLGKNRFFSMTVSDERGAVPQAFTVRIFPDGSADPADGVFNYTAGVGGSATTTTTK